MKKATLIVLIVIFTFSSCLGINTYFKHNFAVNNEAKSNRINLVIDAGHGGIDFPCPTGTKVCAAADGKVIVAKELNYSYGHYIIIDHGNGLTTLYAHNSKLLVGVGDTVTKGQAIAYSGSTGNSTGPHCHFEVRVNGVRVNPENYL